MHEKMYQAGEDPMQEYREDMKRQEGHGETGQPERMLSDIKPLYSRFHQDLTEDQMSTIPILSTGTALEQGSKYVDLGEKHPQEFAAHPGQVVKPHNYIVAKSKMEYTIWNYLIGVHDPARLDQGDAS